MVVGNCAPCGSISFSGPYVAARNTKIKITLMATKMEKPLTKTELLTGIADETGLTKKEVAAVLASLESSIKKSLGRTGCGKFVLPGLVKVEKVKVAARKARKGVPNPFKPGELMDVKSKPASTKIKVRALKSLKDM